MRRALIFTNGIMEETGWLSGYLQPDDFLIAADGGSKYLQDLGQQPDLLVGDLDSISNEDLAQLRKANVKIIHYPEDKDQTDLELALDVAVHKDFKIIRILAALGGRLDQTLGNISLLASPSLDGIDVRIENGDTQVMLIRDHIVIEGQVGDGISLLPFHGASHNIHTVGLKYPLVNESLYPDRTRGISNVMLDSTAKIIIGQGSLLCIHKRL